MKGGYTPLFNAHHAFKLLPEDIVKRITGRKLSYVWTIPREGVAGGMKVLPTSWKTFFGTDDAAEVDKLVQDLKFSRHEYLYLGGDKIAKDEPSHLRLYMDGPMV